MSAPLLNRSSVLLCGLRDGKFFTHERIRLWAIALLIGWAVGIGFLIGTAHGLNDYAGRPLGSDFSDIYSAGTYAVEGEAAKPFDPRLQYAREQQIFGARTPFFGWHYPPFFLFVADTLATMPYLLALFVWQAATLALYLIALTALIRAGPAPELSSDRMWLLLAIAFPAVFVNLTHGHNGFLTAALMAAGLATLEKRPALAGMLFGLLVYKPQFAILIPLALVAAGQWRAIAAALVTVILFAFATTLVFGPEVWPAFMASTHFTRSVVLEQGGAGWPKIQSVFSWVRMWGGTIPLAYALQSAVSVAVGVSVFVVWRRSSMALAGALLCIGTLLATPYGFDYDMMILAPAIVLLAARARKRGLAPYGALVLSALWLVPFLARPFAVATHVPLGAPVLLAAFAFVFRQGWLERRNVAEPVVPALYQ